MSTNNAHPVPTEPGFYYYRGGDIVHVYGEPGHLWVMMFGTTYTYPIEKMNSALWLGPVPMPGEWAPRELFEDLRYSLQDMRPGRATMAVQVLSSAREWSNANPEPEEKP